MNQDTKIEKIALFVIALAAMVVYFYSSQPTDEDIQRCIKSTNYTADKCKLEITR